MRTSYQPKIREALRSSEDGLSVKELAERLGAKVDAIRASLRSMPDAYIDRWTTYERKPAAVWCAVEVPEDCPQPKKVRKE